MADFNQDLLGDLARQKVVLFLGAGVSASAITALGGRIPGWPEFLDACSNEINDPLRQQVKDILADRDYLLACELLKTYHADQWEDILSSTFGQTAKASPLHSALLGLRQRIVLTTNFDKVFETAWTACLSGSTHYPKVIAQIDESIFRILKDHDGNFILKIHGTIDQANTLIFSRSEYIRMAFHSRNYSNFLESLLLNYTFLYVGFSMNDPAIVSLMEMYALHYPTSRPHYIFVPQDVPENIVSLHKRLRKLVVMQYDSSNNHAHLLTLIKDLAEQARDRRRSIIAELVHSSENLKLSRVV